MSHPNCVCESLDTCDSHTEATISRLLHFFLWCYITCRWLVLQSKERFECEEVKPVAVKDKVQRRKNCLLRRRHKQQQTLPPKVTPHLSPARRPAGPPNLMTKCQNPALGSHLTPTDVEELLHMSNPLFFICDSTDHTHQSQNNKNKTLLTTNTKR